jgi:hypothetical protein
MCIQSTPIHATSTPRPRHIYECTHLRQIYIKGWLVDNKGQLADNKGQLADNKGRLADNKGRLAIPQPPPYTPMPTSPRDLLGVVFVGFRENDIPGHFRHVFCRV